MNFLSRNFFLIGGEATGLGVGLHFLVTDFCDLVADLADGEFHNFEIGLVVLGLQFSECFELSLIFDLFDFESFKGVVAPPAVLGINSIGKVAGSGLNRRVSGKISRAGK